MLLQYAKKYSKLIAGQLLFATVWVLSQLAIPRLMVDIVDYGIMAGDMNEIVSRGMLMLLATVVNIVSLLISIYFLTRVTAGIARDLRGDLFNRIIGWSKETRGGLSNSTLVTRTVNDVKQVSMLVDLSLRKIYTLTITVIGAVIISFSIDVKMAAIILIIIPVIFILALKLTSKALPKYGRIRQAIDRMNQRFRENVTGIRVVKAFNKSDYETKKFQEATKEACQAKMQ
jgi:ATP-binding cassette subfamily B multidrug efflux pump